MTENFIIYGIYIYFAGILVSIAMYFFARLSRFSNAILLLASLAGFIASFAYILFFPGKELVFLEIDSFFNLGFSIDFLSAIFLSLVSGLSGLVVIYSAEYLKRYQKIYNIQNVQILMSIFILGMAGVILSINIIGFMMFWEIMSFASFFLVMADGKRESSHAAFIYFVMTHLGAGAILGGFLILSGGDLGFRLNEIAGASQLVSSNFLIISFLLFFFGFGSKAGLIPFHIWLPEAHPQAPTNISALMSGLMLKIAAYGFLKTVLMFSGMPVWAALLVMCLGIISALLGALYTVVERDIKKAFAYSSIENMGIVFLMLGMAMYVTANNVGGDVSIIAVMLIAYAIFHIINHAVFKTGLFLSSGVIINRIHSKSLDVMGGLAKAMPIFSFIFLIIIIASAALPPLGTFYGEWGFIRTTIELLRIYGTELFPTAVLLAVLSLFSLVGGLAVFAMIKIYSLSMLGLSRGEKIMEKENERDNILFIIPLAIIGLSMVALGIFAGDIIGIIAGNIEGIFFTHTKLSVVVPVSSEKVFLVSLSFLILSFLVYKMFVRGERRERKYQTWDCGQPIDASMEYTATAFSAPIRFFFLPLMRRSKVVVSVPILSTNKWIAKKSFSMNITPVLQSKLYKPAAKYVFWLAEKIRLIHTGRIQYYLLLLFITIIITLMIAL